MFKIKWLSNQREKLSTFLSAPIALFALVIPLTVYYFTLYLKYPEQQSLFDDWFLFIFSITLLFYGYLLGGNTLLWESREKYRFYFLTIAAMCALILFYNYWGQMKLPKQQGTSLYVFGILSAIHIWTIILAVCGFGKSI
jgi:glucan biosynthesis protein C